MPTLPSEQDGPAPHRARATAQSFGVDPARYDRTRQPYPTALVDRVLAASPGRAVLDVGAGTGILARQFQAAGAEVLGVEPDERMAAFARAAGLEVEVARFEDWAPRGRAFDAVVAGTAWHWVDPVAGAAKAAAALRPGGVLSVCWHAFEQPTEMTTAFGEVYRRLAPDSPFDFRRPAHYTAAYEAMATTAEEGVAAAGGFAAATRWAFEWSRWYSRAEWLDQLPTSGVLTTLPPAAVAEVLAGVGAAIDALGGGFTVRYTTLAVTATRLPV